jgi:hypothetical protein
LKLNKESNRQWRRGSESNEVFTDCQPQHPDLQGYFNAVFKRLQEVSDTIRPLPDLTRHAPAAYSVIEEIVEGILTGLEPFADAQSTCFSMVMLQTRHSLGR